MSICAFNCRCICLVSLFAEWTPFTFLCVYILVLSGFRTIFTTFQVDEMEKAFNVSLYPDVYAREAPNVSLDACARAAPNVSTGLDARARGAGRCA